jgi:hypothetical protein
MKKQSMLGLIGALTAVVLVGAGQAFALVITANDDTYLDQTASTTVRDYPGTAQTGGILMKGQTGSQRIGIIEFTLPNVDVTSATFNMLHFRSWTAGVSWVAQVFGKVASFDENTITWGNSPGVGDVGAGSGAVQLGSDLTMAGGNSGQDVVPAQWRSVDMTSFFNANKGQTITIVLKNKDNSSTRGGTVEDREGARTGNIANAPYIDYVPEPATLGLMVIGLGMLARRRAA